MRIVIASDKDSLRRVLDKLLEASPVVTVEAFADLRTDVRQAERGVHRFLRALVVCCGSQMPSIIARAAAQRVHAIQSILQQRKVNAISCFRRRRLLRTESRRGGFGIALQGACPRGTPTLSGWRHHSPNPSSGPAR
eukprot:scaffold106_cov380-Prasinococcus_capsulatus_cf.AAC.41